MVSGRGGAWGWGGEPRVPWDWQGVASGVWAEYRCFQGPGHVCVPGGWNMVEKPLSPPTHSGAFSSSTLGAGTSTRRPGLWSSGLALSPGRFSLEMGSDRARPTGSVGISGVRR